MGTLSQGLVFCGYYIMPANHKTVGFHPASPAGDNPLHPICKNYRFCGTYYPCISPNRTMNMVLHIGSRGSPPRRGVGGNASQGLVFCGHYTMLAGKGSSHAVLGYLLFQDMVSRLCLRTVESAVQTAGRRFCGCTTSIACLRILYHKHLLLQSLSAPSQENFSPCSVVILTAEKGLFPPPMV